MLSPFQAVLFLLFSVVTFASYQFIPGDLARVHKMLKDRRRSLTPFLTSNVFTLFIRFCGVDHLLMGLGMPAMSLGLLPMDSLAHHLVSWLILLSAAAICIVSTATALLVRREIK